MKEKYVRGNKAPYMNKSILKAIMARTRLLNRLRNEITFLNQLAYKRHLHFSVKLLKKKLNEALMNFSVLILTASLKVELFRSC